MVALVLAVAFVHSLIYLLHFVVGVINFLLKIRIWINTNLFKNFSKIATF